MIALAFLHAGECSAIASASVNASPNLKGVVVDATSGEPLARVRVRVDGAAKETVTNEMGQFEFDDLEPGEHTIAAETVGYRLRTERVQIVHDRATEVTIALTGDAVRLNESVTVTASDPFTPTIPSSPSGTQLGAAEIRNLSSVLLDDPIRSMSTLPGVMAPDDNRSSFAVRGAPFQHVGVFLDDVPIRTPSHAFGASIGDGFSISLLNAEVLGGMTLLSVAPPPAYAGEIGAAVAAETRDGSRDKPLFHASLSLLDTNLLAEGPLGSSDEKRGSWFLAYRKSYINIRRKQTGGQQQSGLTFTDVQGKLTYDLSPKNTVSIHVLTGSDGFNADNSTLSEHFRGPNTVGASTGSTDLIKANWRMTPTSALIISTTSAFQRAREDERSQIDSELASSHYADASAQTNVTWSLGGANGATPLRAGYAVHRSSDHGTSALALFENPIFNSDNAYSGNAVFQYAYLQQEWTSGSGRVHLTGGLRWQSNSRVSTQPVLPFVSSAFQLNADSKIELGWGRYAQFPEIDMIELAASPLSPERSTHYVAAFEHRLDPQTRIRIEAYDRENTDVLDVPDIYPRLQGGQVVWPTTVPLWKNAYDGYSRGVQV
ncbi:MAG TPA: TonB-dependent receptor, partial [Vicinamibacterales bacterium]|nr:TonB-dependent receptor [Vicinamibacterales bacterium]